MSKKQTLSSAQKPAAKTQRAAPATWTGTGTTTGRVSSASPSTSATPRSSRLVGSGSQSVGDPVPAAPQRSIPASIMDLRNEVTGLENLMLQLNEYLRPIMNNDDEAMGEKPSVPMGNCDIANDMIQLSDRVSSVSYQVRRILNRAEL